MSLLGKVFKAAKKGVQAVGKVASKAAPIVGMIPGVGTLAAAGLGAGGALIGGESLGTALRRGVAGGAGGLLGGALRGTGLGGSLASKVGGIASKLGGGATGEKGGGGDGFQSILGPLLTGAAGVSGASAANRAGRNVRGNLAGQTAAADFALGQARDLAASAAPVRGAAAGSLTSLLTAGPRAAPNVDRFADTRNPFRARFGTVGGGAPPAMGGPGLAAPPLGAALPPPPSPAAAVTGPAASIAADAARRRRLAANGLSARPAQAL